MTIFLDLLRRPSRRRIPPSSSPLDAPLLMGKTKKPKKRSGGSRSPPVQSSSSPIPKEPPSDEVCEQSSPVSPSLSIPPKNASAVVKATVSAIGVVPVVGQPDLVQNRAVSSSLVPIVSQVSPATATLPVNASADVLTTSSAIVESLEVGSPILGQTTVDLIQVDSVSDPLSVSTVGEVSKEKNVPTVPIVPVVPSAGDSWVNLFSGPSTRSLSKKGKAFVLESGESCVRIPNSVILKNQKSWESFIIGQFYADPPPQALVHTIVNGIWSKHFKDISVSRMEGNAFLFRIPNVQTHRRVLNQRLWQIDGQTMFVAELTSAP